MNKALKKFMWKHFFEYTFEREYKKLLSRNRIVSKTL